jgi:hypothetical protein
MSKISEFIMNILPCCALSIVYKEKNIEEMVKPKILWYKIVNCLEWKNHYQSNDS